ncbi:unnamed protein product [Effrenium voratum]|nr:unnamed protein product [Effrenium voratum]
MPCRVASFKPVRCCSTGPFGCRWQSRCEPQDGPPSVHTRVHDYMNLMRRRGLACLRGLHRGLLRSVLGSGLDIEAAEQGRGLRRGAPQLGGEEVVMDLSLRGSGFSGGRFCLEGKLKPWNLFSSLFFEGEP